MTMLCSLAGHCAGTLHHRNQGLDFAVCHRCGCDLVRSGEDDWAEVPKGFRVVWREFGRESDAGAVAARMARMARIAPPSRSTALRRWRNQRGHPLKGAASVIGLLANLRKVIGRDESDEAPATEATGQYVICLPAGRQD
jgi:hypothetical protein